MYIGGQIHIVFKTEKVSKSLFTYILHQTIVVKVSYAVNLFTLGGKQFFCKVISVLNSATLFSKDYSLFSSLII